MEAATASACASTFEGPKGVLKGLFEHRLRLTREALISTSPTTYTSPLPDGRT